MFFLFVFPGRIWRYLYYFFFFNVWTNLPMKASRAWHFLCGLVFNNSFNFFSKYDYSNVLFFFASFDKICFSRNLFISSNCQIYSCKSIYSFFLLSFKVCRSFSFVSPFFLILLFFSKSVLFKVYKVLASLMFMAYLLSALLFFELHSFLPSTFFRFNSPFFFWGCVREA